MGIVCSALIFEYIFVYYSLVHVTADTDRTVQLEEISVCSVINATNLCQWICVVITFNHCLNVIYSIKLENIFWNLGQHVEYCAKVLGSFQSAIPYSLSRPPEVAFISAC